MVKKFNERIERLQSYYDKLEKCDAVERHNLAKVPSQGVYLFLDGTIPIYVGRTNRMKARLLEHGRKSSGHNDASFAFKLARTEAGKLNMTLKGSRETLAVDKEFSTLFLEAKNRVSKMQIKYVEITDPVDQCLFEVFLSEALETPFNDFDNH